MRRLATSTSAGYPQRHRRHRRIPGAGQHLEREPQVGHRPRERSRLVSDALVAGQDELVEGSERAEPAGGRLERVDAAAVRRQPDAAPGIGADAERREAGGDGRRLAAARAARGPVVVPGVVAAAVERVVGLVEPDQLRDVGLAEHDRAGLAQPTHEGRVGGRRGTGETRDAARRRQAGDVERLLQRDRNAVQRPGVLAPSERPVGVLGLGCRLLEAVDDDGVERRVQPFGPREVRGDHLGARERARSDARCQRARSEVYEPCLRHP